MPWGRFKTRSPVRPATDEAVVMFLRLISWLMRFIEARDDIREWEEEERR